VPSIVTGRAYTGLVVCPVPNRPSGTEASLETGFGGARRGTRDDRSAVASDSARAMVGAHVGDAYPRRPRSVLGTGVNPIRLTDSRSLGCHLPQSRQRESPSAACLRDLRGPTNVARRVRDWDQQRWRRCVGSNPLAPTRSSRCLRPPASDLYGQKRLDQLLHALDHDGWWSAPEPLRARHFSTGCPSPILAEAANASFSEWRRRRQPMCQMPSPSARIVRCSPRPN
jgi:hypothetical protein